MAIGITMGDACGVGPEIILKSFMKGQLGEDFIVIGDYDVLEFCKELLEYDIPLRRMEGEGDVRKSFINVLDAGIMKKADVEIGKISKKAGFAAAKYVETAARLTLKGGISAIVTLPINKEAVRLSIPGFTGHTEFIADICAQGNYTMMLASEKFIVTHVSTHVSMEEAVKNVKADRVYNVIKLTYDALRRFIEVPRIAVAGLNPHAGENGSFGKEDLEEILPAVQRAVREGIRAEGPAAPDTVFLKALKKQYDAVVCMYHDQGHIPLKLLDFEGGVNVTLGLKVIRTSVDHGTAFDIAYKGVASIRSLAEAFKFASKLAGGI